jgi:hypothetical protein
MWVSVSHPQDGRNKTGLMPAGKTLLDGASAPLESGAEPFPSALASSPRRLQLPGQVLLVTRHASHRRIRQASHRPALHVPLERRRPPGPGDPLPSGARLCSGRGQHPPASMELLGGTQVRLGQFDLKSRCERDVRSALSRFWSGADVTVVLHRRVSEDSAPPRRLP